MQFSARDILEKLKSLGVTHVVGPPDNASAALFALLEGDPEVRLVTVTREGEAFALAAGLWMGGRTPVTLIQNTGLLESGDSFRGTVMRMRIPLVNLVTYRGFSTRPWGKGEPEAPAADFLSRPEVDSVAVVTEPTLRAWGVLYYFLENDPALARLSDAFQQAQRLSQPVVVLLAGSTV